MTLPWQKSIWHKRAGAEWSVETRLLYAYLLSGPAANRIGCFPLDVDRAANETGLSKSAILAILDELEKDGHVRFDQAFGWIWVPETLQKHPFTNIDEVRQTLPELSAVPRAAAFRTELVQVFRTSADHPGIASLPEPTWLTGLMGDARAIELARRLSSANDRLRKELPGLPSFDAIRIQPATEKAITILDYTKRCKDFLIDTVSTKSLRFLSIAAIVCTVLFIVFPRIDLGVASWFFSPPRSFTLGETWVGRFFDNEIHYAMEWFIGVLVLCFVVGWIRRKPIWGLTPKRFLFVALSIALGAGLLTNVIFKDSWGRARPSQVMEFGGPKQFSPPFMRSTQCDKNCSFVSGDASLAASFLAFAVIAQRNRRRWWMGLSAFTGLVGLMRMGRGSHFLSDVVFAVLFTLMIMLVLERLILQDRWRNWPRWRKAEIAD